MPPQHPLMTAHFQLTPVSTQQPPSMVLSMPSQPPYHAAQPTVTPSALTAQANQVVHPNPHSMMGNGHLTSHPSLLQPPTLPLTNGQALHAMPTAADNQDGPNGLQMLRTVGSGKYEFSDPGHPKGKHGQSRLVHIVEANILFYLSLLFEILTSIQSDLFGWLPEPWIESKLGKCLVSNQCTLTSVDCDLLLCWAFLEWKTQTSNPLVFIPEQFQMPTVVNKASNIQAVGCQDRICNQSQFTSKLLHKVVENGVRLKGGERRMRLKACNAPYKHELILKCYSTVTCVTLCSGIGFYCVRLILYRHSATPTPPPQKKKSYQTRGRKGFESLPSHLCWNLLKPCWLVLCLCCWFSAPPHARVCKAINRCLL